MMALSPNTGLQAFTAAPTQPSATTEQKIQQLKEIVPGADEATLSAVLASCNGNVEQAIANLL